MRTWESSAIWHTLKIIGSYGRRIDKDIAAATMWQSSMPNQSWRSLTKYLYSSRHNYCQEKIESGNRGRMPERWRIGINWVKGRALGKYFPQQVWRMKSKEIISLCKLLCHRFWEHAHTHSEKGCIKSDITWLTKASTTQFYIILMTALTSSKSLALWLSHEGAFTSNNGAAPLCYWLLFKEVLFSLRPTCSWKKKWCPI